MGAMDEPADKDPHAVIDSQALERRANGRGSARKQSGRTEEPTVVAADGVRSVVAKQAQRYCKDGRPFAVASLDILEYEQVSNVLGAGAAEQLDRLGKVVCTNSLRGSDRVCFFEPGHILILLPDTTEAAAILVMERITQSIASAKLQHKNKPLRASGAFQVAASDTDESGIEILAPDTDALMEEVGYKFDAQGNLYNTQLSSMRLFTKKQRPFSGSFSVWSDRYVNIQTTKLETSVDQSPLPQGVIFIRATAQDQWQANRTVNLKMFELADRAGKFDPEALALVARRARVLQQIDHPGVAKLLDFHSYEDRCLYLIENQVFGKPLFNVRANLETVLGWGVQICNTLIYLQNLMPPLIPPPLKIEDFIISSDNQIVLRDYELPYLLTPLIVQNYVNPLTDAPTLSAPYNRFGMENLLMFLYDLIAKSEQNRKLSDLFDVKGSDKLSEKLNSLFKIRAELKKAIDKISAGATA
jgi:GGDEF domain-containing protein